jgi:hypothetical protein
MIRKAFFLIVFCQTIAMAQQNAFVLIDRSGSTKNLHVTQEARGLIYSLLTGGYSPDNFPGWVSKNIQDPVLTSALAGQAMTASKSWICIMPFGDKDRYKDFQTQQTINFPEDLQSFYNKWYPSIFKDNWTYITIAEAYTARIAYDKNLSDYYIFMATDGKGEQDRMNSKNGYTTEENTVINEWEGPATSEVSKVGIIEKSGYNIIVKKIINRRLNPTQVGGSGEDEDPPVTAESYDIRLTSYANGKLKDPVKTDKEDIAVSWACATCPEGTRYNVTISALSGSKFREPPKKGLAGNSTTYRLPSGKYKITVSGEITNTRSPVSPATTYIEITSGSTAFILAALAAVAAGAGLLLYWSRKQKEQRQNTRRTEGRPGNNEGRPPREGSGDLNIV